MLEMQLVTALVLPGDGQPVDRPPASPRVSAKYVGTSPAWVRWYSLVLFTDGVTEARSAADRDLYGDDRLREVLATLHDMSADQTADAIQQAVLTFSGGKISDDTVALVLTVPPVRAGQAARARGRQACRPAAVPDNRPPAPAPRQRPDGGLAHDWEDLTGPPDDAGLASQRCRGQPAQRRALTDRPRHSRARGPYLRGAWCRDRGHDHRTLLRPAGSAGATSRGLKHAVSARPGRGRIPARTGPGPSTQWKPHTAQHLQ